MRPENDQHAGGRPATIMMVDDEPTTIDVIQMLLEGEGYKRFVPLTDSTRALDTIADVRPDLLLLDLVMPQVGGLEILRAMRSDPSFERVPVVILTSSADAETKLAALELGATDFLAKPVDPSELALRIRNTLAAKAYQDRLAYYDELTALPNRRHFLERLELALGRARQLGAACALLRIDLDRFKEINDTLGHAFGDAVLKSVADRLAKYIGTEVRSRENWTLFRVGGDEFAVVIEGMDAARIASRLARSILLDFSEPLVFGGKDFFATCSLGIALSPGDGADAKSLLANSGAALSQAKREGGNTLEFYDRRLNVGSRDRLMLANQLRGAIDRQELRLHYQPKLDVATGRIVGAEALARWTHSELGNVPPDRFIAVAEETGLIGVLGEWALDATFAQAKAWQTDGLGPLSVAVNVSGKQFRPGEIVERIGSGLEAHGLEGSSIVLELTERVVMDNPQRASGMLHALKEMGLTISIDDFGTGYSSLSYLKRFPIDELKIDRSFIFGLPGDADGGAIVDAIIAMSQSLGLRVVAEGVETPEQLAFLKARGCDHFQGFLHSPAIPASDWPELLASSASGLDHAASKA